MKNGYKFIFKVQNWYTMHHDLKSEVNDESAEIRCCWFILVRGVWCYNLLIYPPRLNLPRVPDANAPPAWSVAKIFYYSNKLETSIVQVSTKTHYNEHHKNIFNLLKSYNAIVQCFCWIIHKTNISDTFPCCCYPSHFVAFCS